MTIPVGIVGFRGYSGAELEKILARHQGVRVIRMEHRADTAAAVEPVGWETPRVIACNAKAAKDAGVELVFLATPVDVSIELSVGLLNAGIRVVDLSGAFRLGTIDNFTRWYREPHAAPQLLGEAIYGLPEFNRTEIRSARLISNPGCYPTAANLAIRPLIDADAVDLNCGIVCDAKSGVSGAGRKASLKTSFCEVTENFSAYSLLNHRHVPEVLMNSGLSEGEFSFTAQLIPVHRGILETIYCRTKHVSTAATIFEIYERRYRDEPFVRLYKPGEVPDLKSVSNTNFCDIGFQFDPATNRLVVVTTIDNLIKGAAGQAIQNMNLMLGFPETECLL